jgi:transposase
MTIQNYELSTEAIEALQSYRDNQEDIRLKIRFIAILLLAKGTDIRDIAAGIGKSPSSIERWFETYVSQGIDTLNSFGYKPKKALLSDDQMEQLSNWVKETYPPHLKVVRAYVQETFNITYTINGIRKLLKKRA